MIKKILKKWDITIKFRSSQGILTLKRTIKVFDFTALKITTHIRWTLPSTLFLFRALLAKNGSNSSFLWIIKQPLNLHLDFVGGSWNFPGWLPRKKIGSKNWIFFSCFGTGFLKPRFLRLVKILGRMRNI